MDEGMPDAGGVGRKIQWLIIGYVIHDSRIRGAEEGSEDFEVFFPCGGGAQKMRW
jgi:hypothetical protein